MIERREQAINLRRAGLSLREIAKRLTVDPMTIHEDLKVMMAESIKENVDNADQLRAMELERMDKLLLNLSPLLQPKEGKTPDIKAVNAAIKISEQRAKLLGLYAPTKIEGTFDHHVKAYKDFSPDGWDDDTLADLS